MRRSVLLAAATALAAGLASSAGAYGGGASHDTWQIGISGNCNNPTSSFCQNPETGLPELGASGAGSSSTASPMARSQAMSR